MTEKEYSEKALKDTFRNIKCDVLQKAVNNLTNSTLIKRIFKRLFKKS